MLSDTNLGKINSAEDLDLKSNNLSSTYLNLRKIKSLVTNSKDASNKNSISGYYLKPCEAFGIKEKIISDNIIFINQTKLLFISGCNLVTYDLSTNETSFILRNSPLCHITSMSVGQRTEKDFYICIGEFNQDQNKNQISVISLSDNSIQYVLCNKDARAQQWKIIFSRILKNSSNCVSIAKKENNLTQTKLAFWKFTQQQFIAEAIIEEDIRYFSFNPKNTYELVVCGKNYLRLWNVFINQGILREHPQRFLKSKQEKDYTFVNIDFFDRKAFTFIVGTLENVVFVIEGFLVLAEINCGYVKENIYELNLQSQFSENDEGSDEHPQASEHYNNNNNNNKSLNYNNNNNQENSKTKIQIEDSQEIINSFQKIKSIMSNNNNNQIKTKSASFFPEDLNLSNYLLSSQNNPLRCVRIVGANQILVTFQNDALTYIYTKMDREIRLTAMKKEDSPSGEAESINTKNKPAIQEETRVERLANNIKQIINVFSNDDGSKIIYFVEVFNKEKNAGGETSFRLLLFNKKGNMLVFEKEIFRNYISKFKIKKFGVNEKMQIFYTLNENNLFRCFDFKNKKFLMQHSFSEEPLEVVSCPNNNVIGVSFKKKFSLFFLLKKKIVHFLDFEVLDSNGNFTEKGEFLAISGCNPYNKTYSILFFDTFNFNVLHAIENVKAKVKKFLFIDNDKFLFVMFDNGFIRGFALSFDYLSFNLMNRFRDRSKPVNNAFVNLIFKHQPKGDYHDFEYDYKNDLLVVTFKNENKLTIINKKGNNVLCTLECEEFPESIKLIHELKCLLVGMQDGEVKIYKWPFEVNETSKNLSNRENLMYRTNLHFGSIINMQVLNNLSFVFTASSDGSVYFNELFVKQAGEYRFYNKLFDFFGNKPKMDSIINVSDLFKFNIGEIRAIDFKVESLIKTKNMLEKSNKDNLELKRNDYEKDLKSMEEQKNEAIEEENKKLQNLLEDIKEMKQNVEQELQLRQSDHDQEKTNLQQKYDEKLKLYKNEIERLNSELRELENTIEEKFKNLAFTQNDSFNNLFNNYLENFNSLKSHIESNIEVLVKTNADYDDALEKGKSDYDRMIQQLKETMASEIDSASKIIEEKKIKKTKVLSEENNLRNLLDTKVAESDDIIKKNVQIKQNIIDTTQRSITLQEQLLETEKNLLKIDKKMEDLQSNNNHLEQIRFVLEHRMTALEKEKGPLEDQCYMLENQKYSLQSEFNRLILEINKKNQVLENKQSQLKASLIQNFEVNDHIAYMKKKLIHLQVEVLHFIKKFHDENMKSMSLQEKKATTVALHLRNFYAKYFETNIDHELLNYKVFSQKLQEESDKISIANNTDLMLRDKGEEKILNENFKMDQIELQKEKGFKRMQDENTILISECNRLRKNLHEVYMHVIDIEKKFEDLTKINPTLRKTEIVTQIKNFIKKTHHIIKNNYEEHYLDNNNNNFDDVNFDQSGQSKSNTFYNKPENSLLDLNADVNRSSAYQGDLLKNLNSNQNNLVDQKSNLEAMNNQIIKAINNATMPDQEFENKNDYENFLILPEIKNQNLINVQQEHNIGEAEVSSKRLNTHSALKDSRDNNSKSDTSAPKKNLPKI